MTEDLQNTSSPVETNPEPVITPEQFIKDELIAARKQLKNIQLYGSIVVVIIMIYVGIISVNFVRDLQPKEFATLVKGMTVGKIEETRGPLIETVRTRVPEMIKQVPDMVVSKLPEVRQHLEVTFETKLRENCQLGSANLSEKLGTYMQANKEQINALLKSANDSSSMAEIGKGLHDELLAYLDTPSSNGMSIVNQINESRVNLLDLEKTIHKLAIGKNLTDAEKKTQLAVALIANAIEAEKLQPVTLPQFSPEAMDEDKAPVADDQSNTKSAAPAAPAPAAPH